MRRNQSDILSEKHGFTLIEILLVLVIFSISAALVAPVIGGGIGVTETKTTAKRLGAALNQARNLAVREKMDYLVKVSNENILIATGKGVAKKEFIIPRGVSVSQSPAHATVFNPRGGSNGGMYIVKGDGGEGFKVKVTSSGYVKIEMEAGGKL